jgi:hypothetical protein
VKKNKTSRVQARAGKKALVCQACVREAQGKNGRNIGSFRGRPRAYLAHLVHGHGRSVRPASG